MSKFIAPHSSLHKQTAPVIASVERPVGWFKKSLCFILSLAMFNSLTLPMAYAYSHSRQQDALQASLQQGAPVDRYVQGLDSLAKLLDADNPVEPQNRLRSAADTSLDRLRTQMEHEADALRQQWQDLRTTWEQANIDPGILAQQAQLEATFEDKHNELIRLLNAAAEYPGDTGHMRVLQDFLAQERPSKTHLPINLDNLPWQVEQPKPVTPATTDADANARLHEETPTQQSVQPATQRKSKRAKTAQPATPPVAYRLAVALEQENKRASASLRSTTTSVGTLAFATAPTAADLAETLDAQQTDEIKALAHSLDNNPHKIYQWVHDNIHYFPSHGSVQGAQDTLDKKRGNAFDTNSLLVALLRSAGIPARYVYGSIELPVAQVQNWVGGTQTADAAQQLLSQGGVPNAILTKGGKDFAFRLEHVWVEAFIQYHPGRGATHQPGHSTPDSWIAMDGSFKQYTYADGMDLQTAVPFDAEALISAAQQGAEINEAEGWIRGLNSAALEAQLKTYQAQLEGHINRQNAGNSTIGDVLGSQQAQIDPLPYLAGSLPYTIKARSQQFSEIPEARRAKFRYEIYSNQRMAAWGDSPVLSWQIPTVSLAGKKVTLAWVAANEASEKAIEALIPANLTDPSQLPTGLSSSISLKPEIRLDGHTVATGPAFKAGDEPIGAGSFTRYGSNQWDTTTDQLIAGQQTALGISIQGISSKQLDTLKTRMEHTKATLEKAQTAPQSQREQILKDLTGEHLTGDMLTATIWGYFASLQNYAAIAQVQFGMIDHPGLSYGLFHLQGRSTKLYGLVNTGFKMQGLNMDIGHMRYIRWVEDDNPNSVTNNKNELTKNGKSAAQNRWIAYNKARGQHSSSVEHATQEIFWIDKSTCRYIDANDQVRNPMLTNCAEGVSAVKALAVAQSEGQKIYTINKNNRATALPKLTIGGDVGAEIRSAINAGKEVTFHERAINAHGWTGHGYIIVDPDTGAGAYLIEGSGNGGILYVLLMKLVALFYVIFFKVMMVPVYVAGGINLAFVALVSLASCALDLDNSSSLLINSISLLILSRLIHEH